MLEETTDRPILIGRHDVIALRAERAGLTIRPERYFDLVNPEGDPRYRDYRTTHHEIMQRCGVKPDIAKAIMRTNTTAIAAVMVHRGEADSNDLRHDRPVSVAPELRYPSARNRGTGAIGALSLMILENGPLFITDTHMNPQPTSEQIAETAIGAARHVVRFAIEPKVALCSHSQFGNFDCDTAIRMRAPSKSSTPNRASSPTKARCTPTPHSTRQRGSASSRTRGSKEQPTC